MYATINRSKIAESEYCDKFVVKVAMLFYKRVKKHLKTIELDDLISAGYVGILRTNQRSYIQIRNGIVDELRKWDYNTKSEIIDIQLTDDLSILDQPYTVNIIKDILFKEVISREEILSEKERNVLQAIYLQGRTQLEYSKSCNLSAVRINHIKNSAIRKLKQDIFGDAKNDIL